MLRVNVFVRLEVQKHLFSINSQEEEENILQLSELQPIEGDTENNENEERENDEEKEEIKTTTTLINENILQNSPELIENNNQQKLKRQQNPLPNIGTSIRPASHDVYLWPSMTEHEKTVIRDAFIQIHRRTCIRFSELDYKPWYHAERWAEGKPYIVIRKSKKFSGYSDNNIEDVNRRSLIYLSEQSLNSQNVNNSRGMVMEQLLKFMGYREEFLRPDAPSYIQPISDNSKNSQLPKNSPKFSNEQLMWPFDPESITIPSTAREWLQLTIYCQARRNSDIGAGQRAGLLTRWDAVKLNSMYCPQAVGYADPRMGPCVVPRKPKI
uniref:Astacin domain-containing protein n=1 Tax=Meloidogyne hapla TaxID=6305 RepID=A0A1I8B945_MELHA